MIGVEAFSVPVPPTTSSPIPTVAALLRHRQTEILQEWEARVRDFPVARGLDRPALVDHVPELLERIADVADRLAHGHEGAVPPETADAHALERLELGFDLSQVVAEYAALREIVVSRILRERTVEHRTAALRIVNQAIDRAIAASVDRYTQARERTLAAIDRISTAAFESPSLDDLLQRLLQVFRETTGAVDTIALYLRDGDVLRMRAAVGLDEELAQGFSVRVGEGFSGTIAATMKALELTDAAASPLIQCRTIRRKGIKALYGVPLIEDGEVIGAAHMGSLRAHQFSKQDKRLFTALAARATTAIVQQMLREGLERERALLAAVVEQLPAGVIIAEAPSGRLLHGNRRVDEIWRRSFLASAGVAQYVDWEAYDAQGRRIAAEDWALASAIQKGQTVEQQEAQIVRGDGTRSWILNSAAPVRDAVGRVVAAVATFVDIGERKRDEMRLHALMTDLEHERRRFLDIVNNLDYTVIWESDESGRRFSFVSERAAAVTGFTPAEWVEGADFWSEHVPHDDLARLDTTLDDCRAAEREGRCSHRFVAQDGRTLWMQTGVHFMHREGRGIFRGATVDVTPLQEALRMREDVLAIVSHDLRSPLGVLMNAAWLVRTHARDPAKHGLVEKSADTSLRVIHRMTRLIDDLMDFASIQAGSLSVQRAPTDLNQLVADVVANLGGVAAEKGLSLEADVAEPLPEVIADRDRIVQVFSNLIGNAIRLTPIGGFVHVRARPHGREVLLSVADSGPGIAVGDLHRIFDRYWRVPGQRRDGAGLGLAIAKALVEEHGGRIWADSAPGAGATFHFTLPVA
jgi:PAS domain S-box-containing protein